MPLGPEEKPSGGVRVSNKRVVLVQFDPSDHRDYSRDSLSAKNLEENIAAQTLSASSEQLAMPVDVFECASIDERFHLIRGQKILWEPHFHGV